MPGKWRDVTGPGPGDLSSMRLECETGAGWRGPDSCNTSLSTTQSERTRHTGNIFCAIPDIYLAKWRWYIKLFQGEQLLEEFQETHEDVILSQSQWSVV